MSRPQANQREDISSQNEQKQSLKDVASRFVGEESKYDNNLPTEPADAVREANAIPKFDLAEQILAEQRKITAIKRKAPGKKNKAPNQQSQAQSIGYTIKQPPPILSEQEQIIAEIVARDIEKLYRGDTSSRRNW